MYGVTGLDWNRTGKGTGQNHLTRLKADAMRCEALAHPGDAFQRVAQYATGQTGLFDLTVEVQHATGPAQVDIHRLDRTTAHDDTGVGGVVGDGVVHLAGVAGFRIGAQAASGDQLQGGDNVVGGVDDIKDGNVFTEQRLVQYKSQFDFDTRVKEVGGLDGSAIFKQHVVQQHTVIRLVDIGGHLHGA